VPLSVTAVALQTSYSIVIQDPGYDPLQRDPFGFNPNRIVAPAPPSATQLVDLHVPRNDQMNLGVQRVLSHALTLSADAVAARGHDLLVTHDLNYPDPVSHVRPNAALQRITAVESRGNSWYRALQIGAERPYAHRYSYTLAYTWSSSLRDTEDASFIPQDQNNFAGEKGPATNDVRHRFAAALNVDAVFGLRCSAIASAQGGSPYTVTTGTDDNLDLYNNDRPIGTGRNSVRGAGIGQLDLRIAKSLRAKGQVIEVLLEGFNVTNRANWTSYEGKLSAGKSFGMPKDALPARQIQAGVRINFWTRQ